MDPVIHVPRAYASRGSGGSDMGFSEGGKRDDDDDDGRHARDRESEEEEVAVWLPVGAAGRPPE